MSFKNRIALIIEELFQHKEQVVTQKKKGREERIAKSDKHQRPLDLLEMGTVTFACDLYPDHSASLIESAKLMKKRAQEGMTKKRAA